MGIREGLAAAAAWMLVTAGAAMAQEPVPSARFLEPPSMSEGVMSPEGTHLALIVGPAGQRRRLVVMDVESMTAKVVASAPEGEVVWANWLNDRRLVFRILKGGAFPTDTQHAVDRDGTNMSDPIPPGHFEFGNRSRTNDDFFQSYARFDNRRNFQRYDLMRVNSRTFARTRVQMPGETVSFVLDDADVPLAVVTREPPGRAVWYQEGGQWRKLAAYEQYAADTVLPLAPGPAGSESLFVVANNGRDTSALHLFDLKTNQLDPKPVLSVSGYDFSGTVLRHNGKVIGVRYAGDTTAIAWMDPQFRAMQEKIDALLPATQNELRGGVRHKTSKWLVFASSDVDPGRFFLFDSKSGELTAVGAHRQGIDPKRMARVDMVRYAARDGLSIPARVTLPAGRAKPLPLVVLVDPDPWTRSGHWGWHGTAQFLASRGYAVIQPEHRGTQGYGSKHFEAGWKQFGLAMQDDLADGVKWAVAQGIADPQKVCIAGFEYGGYAALMALAKDAEVFRCGIALHPITDLEAYASNFLAFNEEHRTHGLGRLIGDTERDAAQLRATSPVHRAADIRRPLLLGAWDGDRAIPFQHASRMREALQSANANVEWHALPEVRSPEDRLRQTVALWDRIEQFLIRHNPPGRPPSESAPAAPQSGR